MNFKFFDLLCELRVGSLRLRCYSRRVLFALWLCFVFGILGEIVARRRRLLSFENFPKAVIERQMNPDARVASRFRLGLSFFVGIFTGFSSRRGVDSESIEHSMDSGAVHRHNSHTFRDQSGASRALHQLTRRLECHSSPLGDDVSSATTDKSSLLAGESEEEKVFYRFAYVFAIRAM